MIPQANPLAGFNDETFEFLEAARRVLESGWYILGDEVAAFEKEFALWSGIAHVVGCANGTDAIELALRALGAGPGKVVFTVSHTAVATVSAIERAGAVPWMVDVEGERLTMSPPSLESALRECREKHPELTPWAILPVHIYGQPADMAPLLAIAGNNGLLVVEDCAQSHGALYKGRITGGMGDAGAFSLYPTKNLGAFGDAGLVATNNSELAEKMRAMRQYGWVRRYISDFSGINSRMDPMQAAFLRIKLKRLDRDNDSRRRLAGIYDKLLAPALSMGLRICTPADGARHVYHQYVVRTGRRDELQRWCSSRGIGTAVHYPVPVHQQPAYLDRNRYPVSAEGLPETEKAARQVLSLPMYPQLSGNEVRVAAECIMEWMRPAS